MRWLEWQFMLGGFQREEASHVGPDALVRAGEYSSARLGRWHHASMS